MLGNKMRQLAPCHKSILPLAVLFAVLLCSHTQTSWAQSSIGSTIVGGSKGGGLFGIGGTSSTGAISTSVGSVTTNGDVDSNGIGSSVQMATNLGGIAGSLFAGSGGSGGNSVNNNDNAGNSRSSTGSGPSGSLSVGSVSSSGGGSSVSSGIATQAPGGSASTSSPEGLIGMMKQMVRSSVDSLKHEETSVGASASGGASLGSGDPQAAAQMSAKPEGLMDMIGDAAKRSKDIVKDTAKDLKQDVKSIFMPEEGDRNNNLNSNGGSVKVGSGAQSGVNVQIGVRQESNSRPSFEFSLSKLANKGSEVVHKIEDKASELGDKVKSTINNNISNNSSNISNREPIDGSRASIRVGSNGPPTMEDKSVVVEVLDKMHNISKMPAELAPKPIDKALGYQKDPLVKAYGASHEVLRKPLSVVSQQVDSVLSGAFKTLDETKQDQERLLSEQERREIKMREDRARREGRTVLGDISDKTFELIEKPFEIILKPVDHLLGFDKDGKKNPLIKIIDEIYSLTKKPLDTLARPFENILRKMAEGEQAYQVSVRLNADQVDPKLFTRLADGALNIADRVVTKPVEFAMRPLGYDEHKKRNPILDAAHSLKNATKVGVELFTKPIDRIIKEIAEIGAIKDENEREAEIERRRQEASRIVHALDKIHEVAQVPWEIVLRPVGRVLGYNREGRKEPLLRAWDVIHQVVRTPLQVVSKPVEDALLGEQRRPRYNPRPLLGGRGSVEARRGNGSEETRKNLIVDGFKKVEKLAAKPLDVITSPIRKLILGEDVKVGAQARAQVGSGDQGYQVQSSGHDSPDKIVRTIENVNNVVLKPFEMVTQPISDILSNDESKKLDNTISAQAQVKKN